MQSAFLNGIKIDEKPQRSNHTSSIHLKKKNERIKNLKDRMTRKILDHT